MTQKKPLLSVYELMEKFFLGPCASSNILIIPFGHYVKLASQPGALPGGLTVVLFHSGATKWQVVKVDIPVWSMAQYQAVSNIFMPGWPSCQVSVNWCVTGLQFSLFLSPLKTCWVKLSLLLCFARIMLAGKKQQSLECVPFKLSVSCHTQLSHPFLYSAHTQLTNVYPKAVFL